MTDNEHPLVTVLMSAVPDMTLFESQSGEAGGVGQRRSAFSFSTLILLVGSFDL